MNNKKMKDNYTMDVMIELELGQPQALKQKLYQNTLTHSCARKILKNFNTTTTPRSQF
jgi:hypothetical protein